LLDGTRVPLVHARRPRTPDVRSLRLITKPPWRRRLLLILLLVVTLLLVNIQQHAAALRLDLWIPAHIAERTVG
jgi:hypothetical protein